MDNVKTGNDSFSQSVSPEAAARSKRHREDNNPSSERDDACQEETAKRIRLLFPKCDDRLVEVLERILTDDFEEAKTAFKTLDGILENEEGEGTTLAFMQLGGHVNLINAMKKHWKRHFFRTYGHTIINKILDDKRIGTLDEIGGLKALATSFAIVGAFDSIKHIAEDNSFWDIWDIVEALCSCQKIFYYAGKNVAPLFLESVNINLLVQSMAKSRFRKDTMCQAYACTIIKHCIDADASIIESLKHVGVLAAISSVMFDYDEEDEEYKDAEQIMKLILAK